MSKIKNIVEKNIEDLIPYVRNARRHTSEQVTRIAASIKEFGFINPVLIDKNNGIIAGHGRVEAAKKLNMETVPCIFVEHLTETQKRAYILADNKLALDSGWDKEMLKIELEELSESNFDIDFLNFDIDLNKDAELEISENTTPEKEIAYKEQYGVIVMWKDEQEQEKIYDELSERGYDCKVVATWKTKLKFKIK